MTATFTPPLAALITVFTPPCPTTWLLTSTKAPSQFPPFPTAAPASCDLPSWTIYMAERGFDYYSPAICPSGFSVGPSCIITNPRTAQGFPAIQAGETAAYCVPNGHVCTSDTSDFRGGVWGVSRTASTNGAQVTVGPAIQIRWRDSDLESLETDPLTGPKDTITDVIVTPTSIASSTEAPDSSTTLPTPPFPFPQSSSSSPSSSIQSTTTSPISVIAPKSFTTLPSSSTSPSSTTSTPSTTTSSSSSSATPPTTSIPTPESQTSPPPSSSTSQAGKQASDGATPSPPPPASAKQGPFTNFTTAAIILIAILSAIIAAYGGWALLQRYRRYRAGELSTFFARRSLPNKELFTSWALRLRVDGLWLLLHQRRPWRSAAAAAAGDEKDPPSPMDDKRKLPDAELGTEGPVPELGGSYAWGTKENPAELPIPVDVPTERRSWMARLSSTLTARAKSGSAALGPS
ncbi:hypothetical protein GGS24DRAFT_402234 [Hypoxylon argillaceum]|nr:hypothetical protein GGS24DRAFT_402234 [Hypoxylon argillaceum]